MDLGRIMNVDPSGSQPWQHMRIGNVNENMPGPHLQRVCCNESGVGPEQSVYYTMLLGGKATFAALSLR